MERKNTINLIKQVFDQRFFSDLFKIFIFKDKLFFKSITPFITRSSDYFIFPSKMSTYIFESYVEDIGSVKIGDKEYFDKENIKDHLLSLRNLPYEKYTKRGYHFVKKSKLEK